MREEIKDIIESFLKETKSNKNISAVKNPGSEINEALSIQETIIIYRNFMRIHASANKNAVHKMNIIFLGPQK